MDRRTWKCWEAKLESHVQIRILEIIKDDLENLAM